MEQEFKFLDSELEIPKVGEIRTTALWVTQGRVVRIEEVKAGDL